MRIPYLITIFEFIIIFEIYASGDMMNHKQVGGDRKRSRRTPAIWGEPAPDYSLVVLETTNTYLYTLIFVDLKTSDHYRRDHNQVKDEVMRLVKESNNYFYQINLKLIVVDILETYRDDLSLYSFEDYRNQRLNQLPYHNFAVLLSFRYAGGLAFVSGMCSTKSVMVAGFYPHNPEAMGSIFFHEVAHLIGVPHRPRNESIHVQNCRCEPKSPTVEDNHIITHRINENANDGLQPNVSITAERRHYHHQPTSVGCLKIPGFDHDCTLQMMANLVYRNRCLSRFARTAEQNQAEGFVDARTTVISPRSKQPPASIPLCGNGVVEEGENCDCGLERFCNAWNCDSKTCTRPVPLWMIWISTASIIATILTPLVGYLYFHHQYSHRGKFKWMVVFRLGHTQKSSSRSLYTYNPKTSSKLNKIVSTNTSTTVNTFNKPPLFSVSQLQLCYYTSESTVGRLLRFFAKPFRFLKQIVLRRNESQTTITQTTVTEIVPEPVKIGDNLAPKEKTKPCQLIVTQKPPASKLFPSSSSKSSMLSKSGSSIATLRRPMCAPPPPPPPNFKPPEVERQQKINVNNIGTLPRRPNLPPPPLPPVKPSKIFQRPIAQIVPTITVAAIPKLAEPEKVDDTNEEDDRYSISHKFADFDEDDDDYGADIDETRFKVSRKT